MPRKATTKAAAATKATVEETVKTTPVKAEETGKKAPVKKTTTKKTTTTARKTTAKKAVKAVTKKVNLQFAGKDIAMDDIEAKVKATWMEETGKAESEITEIEIYVKPEENAAYYVINGDYVENGRKIEL